MKWTLLLLTTLHAFCFEHLLRPCTDKITDCGVPFVDYVYMINLDERPEKAERTKRKLAKYGIVPYRFSAINGWKLSIEALQSLGLDYHEGFNKQLAGTRYYQDENGAFKTYDHKMDRPGRYFSLGFARGSIGIILSHLSVMKDAYESGYERIWVLEDDIEIHSNPLQISRLIKDANRLYKGKWDVLFTDSDTISNDFLRKPKYLIDLRPDIHITREEARKRVTRKIVSPYLTRLGNRYGAYSMIFTRSGIKKVLDYFEKHRIYTHYDVEFIYIDNFIQLASRREIVSHKPNSPSDNFKPSYTK